VRNYAPREASVHFLIGKICKQLGRKSDAMLHLTTALDLDPKDSNMIKSAIDKLDVPDIDEEDDL
jgi:anaphase-promoting complex subunit 3